MTAGVGTARGTTGRRLASLALATVLLGLLGLVALPVIAVPAAAAPRAAVAGPSTEGQCLQLPADGSRCPVWGHTWSNPGGDTASCANNNVPQNQVAGAGGVYVTGWACDSVDKRKPNGDPIPGNDAFTVAYNLDGSVRWVARYNGPGAARDAIGDEGRGIAVSPSGDRVYVTGGQNEGLGGTATDFRFVGDMVTIAYDAATGAQVWSASYHGPAVGGDMGEQVAVSADGTRVFVAGESQAPDLPTGKSGGSEAATISYLAATGEQDWVSRYRAPGTTRNNAVGATSISVLDGVVYTAGSYSLGAPTFGSGYEVLAIEDDRAAHAGVRRWASLGDAALAFSPARAALTATPNGIFLAGREKSSVAPPSTCPPRQTSGVPNTEFATVSLEPVTGAVRWRKGYPGQTGGYVGAFGLAADRNGSRVFVAGEASGPQPQCAMGITTVAYDGTTGNQVWVDFQPPLAGTVPQGFAITATPDGSRVYAAGLEYYVDTLGYRGDSRVLAYTGAGALVWSGRYNSAPLGSQFDLDSYGYFLGLSPDSSRLYLTTMVNRHDFASPGIHQLFGTVAYDAAAPTVVVPPSVVPETPRPAMMVFMGTTLGLLVFALARARGRRSTSDTR